MKMRLFIILLSLWGTEAVAQTENNYLPFVEEGKAWTVKYVNTSDGTTRGEMTFVIKGDTVIDGRQYKKMFHRHDGDSYYCALREGSGKVYCKSTFREEETLWYDFSLKEGDTIESDWIEGKTSSLHITGTDYIYVLGHKRKRIHISMNNREGVWVEGIGSDLGPDMPYILAGENSYIPMMDKCSVDGQIQFTYTNYTIPSWAEEETGLESQHTDTHQSPTGTFDLQGRRISGSPRPGIYIQQGRKRIIK